MAKGRDKVPTPRLNGAGTKGSTATRGWGMAGGRPGHDLGALVGAIRQIHDHCAAQAGKAVNISLTLRNWAIGFYIHEYEQEGSDRATYGERLLDVLSARLRRVGVAEIAPRTLRQSRLFFQTYPRIWRTLSARSGPRLLPPRIWQTLSAKSKSARAAVRPPRGRNIVSFPPQRLVGSLSFSHFVELCSVVDPVQRAFYESECMRGNWSVRELKRQIGSLYCERSGLSKNKAKLTALVRAGASTAEPRLAIRDPYVFEFLGLRPKEVMAESDVEDALLDRLQEFLLELGHGFCFEARQKRILIGDSHGFVDLVFYHRVLKCHVLIELKVAEFSHEHLGQLNTYVSWFKRHMMSPGDNPPIGILLCTRKDHALVEYALADLPNRLFVSRYQVELPSRAKLEKFIEAQLRENDHG